MANVSVLVSVSSDYIEQIPALIKELESAGMTDIQPMEAVGIIAGRLEENRLEDLSTIEGVARVEPSQEFQLPSPDSSIQ